ncbi:MAG TPA: class D sortase [Terriglobales bacterium]|nr:class D sortase [Terriglobales bacterium]
MQAPTRSKVLRRMQLVLLITGVLLIGIFIAAHIHKSVLSRAATIQFETLKAEPSNDKVVSIALDQHFRFDFSLWDEGRITAYQQSLSERFEPPLAVLRIAKVHLEVPVLNGIDDLSLNRGVGYIPGTYRPGEPGNIGIAGHRDGFFRVLKDVGPGDMIELETVGRIDIYRVNQVVIVKPDDVSVLQPTSIPTLTLVTCYPFYFIGSAPKRYIVHASLVESGRPSRVEQQQNTNSARFEPAIRNAIPESLRSTKETTQ